ncbi:hypothetical protein NDU88_003210 [Pleurodeles waltl]|uniref:Uncharacterized protein n=1 Tax=Pleurodeles waltl TaxID=8319 RepID=A0AAV7T5T9_PLEWA|nr:hypothetical protein NDU88_003210 [Pleurodeles waltl]
MAQKDAAQKAGREQQILQSPLKRTWTAYDLLTVEPVAKKKSQKRKSKVTEETMQENSEGDRRKRKRTVTMLEDITRKLQNVLVSTESDTTLNEPGIVDSDTADVPKHDILHPKNVLETYIKDIQGAVKKLKVSLWSKTLKPMEAGEGKRHLRVVPREVIQRLERCKTEVIQACEAAATDIGVMPACLEPGSALWDDGSTFKGPKYNKKVRAILTKALRFLRTIKT